VIKNGPREGRTAWGLGVPRLDRISPSFQPASSCQPKQEIGHLAAAIRGRLNT